MELDADSPKRAPAARAGVSQHLLTSVGAGVHSATWAPFLVASQPLMPYYGMPLPGHLPPLPSAVAAAAPAAAVPHMAAAGTALAAGVASSAKRKAYAAEAQPAMPSQTAAPAAAAAAPAVSVPAVDAAQPQRAPEVRSWPLAFLVGPDCFAPLRALLCAVWNVLPWAAIQAVVWGHMRLPCRLWKPAQRCRSTSGLHTASKAGAQFTFSP